MTLASRSVPDVLSRSTMPPATLSTWPLRVARSPIRRTVAGSPARMRGDKTRDDVDRRCEPDRRFVVETENRRHRYGLGRSRKVSGRSCRYSEQTSAPPSGNFCRCGSRAVDRVLREKRRERCPLASDTQRTAAAAAQIVTRSVPQDRPVVQLPGTLFDARRMKRFL